MPELVTAVWQKLIFEIANASPLDVLVTLIATVLLLALVSFRKWLVQRIWGCLRDGIGSWWACCRKVAGARAAIDEKGPGLWLTIKHEPLPGIVDRLKNTGKLILTIANLKGGVGKTTLTANLAAHFANPFRDPSRPTRKVLVVDLDFQGSLSSMLFAGTDWRPPENLLSVASQVISGAINSSVRGQLGQPVTGLEQARGVSAFYDLARIENREMVRWLIRDEPEDIRYRLAHLLLSDAVLPHFDVILIDAPPRLTTASIQALCASTHVLIPAILDPLSGDDPVGYFGRQLKAHRPLFPHLKVMGVVGTLTDRRQRGDEEAALRGAADRLRTALIGADGALEHFARMGENLWLPYDCCVRRSTPLARAAGTGVPYVALGENQKGRAVRNMFDLLGGEVKRRWQL